MTCVWLAAAQHGLVQIGPAIAWALKRSTVQRRTPAVPSTRTLYLYRFEPGPRFRVEHALAFPDIDLNYKMRHGYSSLARAGSNMI